MLAYILAIAIGLGSFALYIAAFFFPEIHRKDDFWWSGVGLFYALVLWFCAGRITGGVLLGQAASVALLYSFGWQTLRLRRAIAHPEEQTDLEEFSLTEWVQKRLGKVIPLSKKTPTPKPTNVTPPLSKTPVPEVIESPPSVETGAVTPSKTVVGEEIIEIPPVAETETVTPPSETVVGEEIIEIPPVAETETVTPSPEIIPEETPEPPREDSTPKVVEPSTETTETVAPDSKSTEATNIASTPVPETKKFTPRSFSLTKLLNLGNIFRKQKPESIPSKPETIAEALIESEALDEDWDVTDTPEVEVTIESVTTTFIERASKATITDAEAETLIEDFKPQVESDDSEAEEATGLPEAEEPTLIQIETESITIISKLPEVEETTSEAEITPPSEPFGEDFGEDDESERDLSDFFDELETNPEKPDNSSQST